MISIVGISGSPRRGSFNPEGHRPRLRRQAGGDCRRLWSGARLLVSRAGTVFDAEGRITDPAIAESLKKFLEGFVAHVRR